MLAAACRARRLLWAFCLACGHAKRIDPRKTVVLTGAVTVKDVERRLRCVRCGHRRGRVIPCDEVRLER